MERYYEKNRDEMLAEMIERDEEIEWELGIAQEVVEVWVAEALDDYGLVKITEWDEWWAKKWTWKLNNDLAGKLAKAAGVGDWWNDGMSRNGDDTCVEISRNYGTECKVWDGTYDDPDEYYKYKDYVEELARRQFQAILNKTLQDMIRQYRLGIIELTTERFEEEWDETLEQDIETRALEIGA